MKTKAGPVTLADFRAEARRILRDVLRGAEIPRRFDPVPMALALLERQECAALIAVDDDDAPNPRKRVAAAYAVTVLRLEQSCAVEHRISRPRVIDVVWRAFLQVQAGDFPEEQGTGAALAAAGALAAHGARLA